MKIYDVKREDINKFLEEFYESEEFTDCEEYEIIDEEQFGRDIIVTSGPVCRITDLGLIFIEGTYCRYDDEVGGVEPDWSLTLLYKDAKDEDFDPTNYIYFEQDDPVITLHNFLVARPSPEDW